MKDTTITVLSGDPVRDVATLAEFAGLRACARPGCTVRWVGGHEGRIYCSSACSVEVQNERRRWRRQHQQPAATATVTCTDLATTTWTHIGPDGQVTPTKMEVDRT